MAALGPVATYTLYHSNPGDLQDKLLQTGFKVIDGFDHPAVTDGQVHIRLVQADQPGFKVTYFSRKGVSAKEGTSGVTRVFEAVPAIATTLPKPTGDGNEVIGYVDSLAVHCPDLVAARADLEDVGFYVLEEYGEPCFQSDMTDGLIRVSVRKDPMQRSVLLYETDLDAELASYLQEVYGDAVNVVGSGNDISVIRIALHPQLDVMCVQAIDLFGHEE